MAKKLFVGNLPYTATSDELKELFSQVGAVESATVVTDKFTGRSRGFGFVEMSDADADKAIETLNGSDMGGRNIMVNEARPMGERPAGGRGGFRSDRPRRNDY
jgi:RNA recognition motif-containing protein